MAKNFKHTEKDGKAQVRIGPDYQAELPNLYPIKRKNIYIYLNQNRALPHWKPTDSLTDAQIEEYVSMAKNKYQYAEDQALGFLLWHEYDLSKATEDMSKFCPKYEAWTEDDAVYFNECLRVNRKNLLGISRQMGKTMNTILLRYYSWKTQKKGRLNGRLNGRTLVQIKKEVQDEDSDEGNQTLGNIKQEVQEEKADEMDCSLTLLQIKKEPVSDIDDSD